MEKELEKSLKKRAFDFACEVTKEAAKGGHDKEPLSIVLENVYDCCLRLLKNIEE